MFDSTVDSVINFPQSGLGFLCSSCFTKQVLQDSHVAQKTRGQPFVTVFSYQC